MDLVPLRGTNLNLTTQILSGNLRNLWMTDVKLGLPYGLIVLCVLVSLW
jgi:hypothetical protein